ncbi:MAG TPA: hypothetical protein VME17_07720 [Bryobacteraceae bacterium]|nr:hypothetical protein [Bryobacteraceae bacterium]
MKFFAITLLSLSTLAAQTAIRPPQMGFAAAADGSLRPVYGVAGNFILGPAAAANVLSQAFSGSLGLLKTGSTLSAFDPQGHVLASIAVTDGPALFAFSPDGVTALAYVASSNTLIEWSGAKFSTVPFQPEADNILSIALPNAFEAALIVQRGDELWEVRLPLTHDQAASQQALPGLTAPVLALASGCLVFRDAGGIVLRQPDNSEVHIPAQLPASFSFQQMSSDWIQLADAATARRFAIRITPGREGFYQLPEAGQ